MSANQYYGGPPQGGQGGPQYPQQSFNGQKGAPNYGGYQQPYGQPPMNQNWQGGKLLVIPCEAVTAVRRCCAPDGGKTTAGLCRPAMLTGSIHCRTSTRRILRTTAGSIWTAGTAAYLRPARSSGRQGCRRWHGMLCYLLR